MGASVSKPKEKILIVGLDASGKTTMLYKMFKEVETTIPTIGFNVETVTYKHIELISWDVGGKDKIRPLWRHYYTNTSSLVFVVDSNDRDRISEAADELHKMLSEDQLRHIPCLVLANKQDLPNAMSAADIWSNLGLSGVKDRPVRVVGTIMPTGQELYESFDWLSEQTRFQRKDGAREIKAAVNDSLGKKLPEDIVNKIGENVRPDWNDLPESKPKPQCSVM